MLTIRARTLALIVPLSISLTAACGGGDSDSDNGSSDVDGGSGGVDARSGGGGELMVPATATTGDADGQAGGIRHAAICQKGVETFELVSGGNTGVCGMAPPGFPNVPYVRFHRTDTDFTLVAGELLGADGSSTTPVNFASTTMGTLVDDTPDEVQAVPEGASVTVVTGERTLTFSYQGDTVTVTEFSAL